MEIYTPIRIIRIVCLAGEENNVGFKINKQFHRIPQLWNTLSLGYLTKPLTNHKVINVYILSLLTGYHFNLDLVSLVEMYGGVWKNTVCHFFKYFFVNITQGFSFLKIRGFF